MSAADQKLEALRGAIGEEIDQFADDESAGTSPIKVGSGDGDDGGEEVPPPPPPAPPAPKPAAPVAEPEPKPIVEPPLRTEAPPAAAGAAPQPAAQLAPATTPSADLFAGFDPQYVNMLRKFAVGGKITTPEELRDAQARAANDYWRTQERMADQARRAAEVPPPTPAEVPPPPELARYDTSIQAVVDEAKGIVLNVQGWSQERVKALNEASTLTARRNRGDSTVDPDAVSEAWARVHEIDGHIQGWNRQYLTKRNEYDSLSMRRGEVEILLDNRARLDRQAQRDEQTAQDSATQEFFNEWSKTLKEVAARLKVPPSRLPALEKRARHATYFAATDAPITDVKGFLSEVVQEFLQPMEEARQEGAAGYTRDKAADAPKVPPQSKTVTAEPAATSLSPRDQLRDLEKRVMDDKAWESLDSAP